MPPSVYKKMRFLWAFISPVTMRSAGHKPRPRPVNGCKEIEGVKKGEKNHLKSEISRP